MGWVISPQITLHTHPNRTNLNPPKIDYIIFLDSDDFWDSDLLESCIKSAQNHNPQIIWFSHSVFYDDIEKPRWGGGRYATQLESFGYESTQTITFADFLQRAKEREIHTFWWSVEGMIDFAFLKHINLRFIKGIIHEDHHFGALLFAQSHKIRILPRPLYRYRIRAGSTMTTWSKDEIPSYLKPLCAHFLYNKARQYFRIYLLVVSLKAMQDFAKNRVADDLRADFMSFILPYLLELCCEVYKFTKDPYRLKPQVADLLKSLVADSPLLPRKIKKHFLLYTHLFCGISRL